MGAGFREVLGVREFRALWAAEVLSVAGDQLARVGLSVLVYAQTTSAGLTALAYALTFLPALVGGALLGGLADRLPRRELMVVVDLLRAVVAGLMAIPTLPLPVLLVLVVLLTLGGGPFKAAQQALLPTILRGDHYVTGLALRTVTNQSAQVAGFLGGGALLVVLDPHLALGANALTFLVAAVVVHVGVAHRPAALGGERAPRGTGAARLIWHDRNLRWLVALSWLVGLFTIPEALAAPYAATLGVGALAVGVLMAADPVGSIVGAALVARIPTHRRPAATVVLAVAAGVPLAVCLFRPGIVVVVVLWTISGACATAYLILAQAAFVLAVPDHRRGAASGLAGAGVLSAQGVAVLGAGLLADATSTVHAVAAGGVAGIMLTGVSGASWLRARSRRERAPVRSRGREDDAEHDPAITSRGSSSSAPPPVGVAAGNGVGSAEPVALVPTSNPASRSTARRSRPPWPLIPRWALWQEPARVRVFVLLVETAAVAVTVLLADRSQVDRAALAVLAVLVGLGLTLGELTRHVERVRRRFTDTPHVNLTSVWTFSAALVSPPVLIPVIVCALYLHLFWRSWYRVRSVHAYRLVFTASTVVLAAHTASSLLHLVVPAPIRWDSAEVVAAAVLAIVSYSVVNSGLVAAAITLHERTLDPRRALGTAKEAALEYGTLGLGAATAVLISIHPGWALLIVPALLVLHRSALMRQLEEAAATDQKTGLTNATAWSNLASTEIDRATRDRTRVGVLMVDLDHFKAVNDAHGHLVGDRVLQVVASTLTTCCRRYDVVGRWGGEEFVVLCPEVTPETLGEVGERIRARVRELRVPLGETGGSGVVDGLSVSIGAASYPEFGPELRDVLLAADNALFVAKDAGRDQVRTLTPVRGGPAPDRSPWPSA